MSSKNTSDALSIQTVAKRLNQFKKFFSEKFHIGGEFCRTIDATLDVLHEKIESENPQPLTLEQCEAMIGEPVWSDDVFLSSEYQCFLLGWSRPHGQLSLFWAGDWTPAKDHINAGKVYAYKPNRKAENTKTTREFADQLDQSKTEN